MAEILDLDNRFTYHTPKKGQPERYESIRHNARNFAAYIAKSCPDSRERSLAICVGGSGSVLSCSVC